MAWDLHSGNCVANERKKGCFNNKSSYSRDARFTGINLNYTQFVGTLAGLVPSAT